MTYLGIDIGGTETKIALLSLGENGRAEIVGRFSEETRLAELAEKKLSFLKDLAEKACWAAGLAFEDLVGCGIALPGPVDRETGMIATAPNLGWTKPLAAAELAEKELGLPVTIENDAACAGIAETRMGAGSVEEKTLLVTLGTGVGASYVVDGEPFSGFGRFGGELGHTPLVHGGIPCSCGIDGCLQQYASAAALARQAAEAAASNPESQLAKIASENDGFVEPAAVFAAARNDDEVALDVLKKFIIYLAEGIGGLVNTLRPDRIIIGGGLSLAGSSFALPLASELGKRVYASDVLPLPAISLAACGSHAGAVGAALAAVPKQL